jgi:hypothetical protein
MVCRFSAQGADDFGVALGVTSRTVQEGRFSNWEKPVNVALTSEMLELVRNGAAPVPPRDRRRYYDLISASLAKCALLTNAALMDAIRAAQRELLRSPAEAA